MPRQALPRRVGLSAALAAALLLAACVSSPPTPTSLPSASFSNTVPVAGVRHVALTPRAEALVMQTVTAQLLVPASASFGKPLVGAEVLLEGAAFPTTFVCGSVTASDGRRTITNVPFVAAFVYARVVAELEGTLAIADIGIGIGHGDRANFSHDDMVQVCRSELGIILPRSSLPTPGASTTRTLPNLR